MIWRLLTIDGWGHSYFEGGRSSCANEIIATYLIDLELPAPGTICPEDQPALLAGWPTAEATLDSFGATDQTQFLRTDRKPALRTTL